MVKLNRKGRKKFLFSFKPNCCEIINAKIGSHVKMVQKCVERQEIGHFRGKNEKFSRMWNNSSLAQNIKFSKLFY